MRNKEANHRLSMRLIDQLSSLGKKLFLIDFIRNKEKFLHGGTISDIVKVVDGAAKQIILQINPSISKITNTTLILLDNVESKIHRNDSQTISTLHRNLFLWRFLTIIFLS